MSSQTQPSTGKQVPDTATTYERAKPGEESPSKSLDQKETGRGNQPDQLGKKDRQPSDKPEHLKQPE